VEDVKRWVESDIIHPTDLPQVVEAFAHAIASGTPFEYEARLRRFDGVHRWFQVRGFPDRDSEGSVARWYVLITDIDDLKRAEALLAGEKRLLEMVASGSALSTVLDALCRLVEEIDANCHCGVYLIDPKNQVFQTSAAPTLPASFNDPIVGRPARSETGPCGMAAWLKTRVIAADVDTDPVWQASPFRPLALTHGLRSCWSISWVTPPRQRQRSRSF
jgi:hypothetical protein